MQTKIYVLTESDGRIRYVGKTCRSLHERLCGHLSGSRKGKHGRRYNWIRSLLIEGLLPKIQLIGEVEGDGCKEEIAWIAYFLEEGICLVNDTIGGDSGMLGKSHSEETRARMSKSRTGKKLTLYHCRRISEGQKGKIISAETRQKLRNANLGNIVSPETRRKISESQKGCKGRFSGHRHSVESRLKVSASLKSNPEKLRYWLGKKRPEFSDLTIHRMSLAQSGRTVSDATRERLRLSHIGHYPTVESCEKRRVSMLKYLKSKRDAA